MMHSPRQFAAGLGRGTSSLVSHVASGVLSSTASVVESATSGVAKGAAFLSGDEAFAKQREEKKRQSHAGGVMSGLKAGGESILMGFSSGLSGLVTKPIEEGRKSGAVGVAKGIGLGLVGAVAKPVMGLTDGIANVAHGVSNQMSEKVSVKNARPARALERSAADVSDLVLMPMDLMAARVQQYLLQKAKREVADDAYVAMHLVDTHSPPESVAVASSDSSSTGGGSVGARPHKLVAVSENYLTMLLLDAANEIAAEPLWRWRLGDVSHCIFQQDFNCIEFIVYKGGSASVGPSVSCGSRANALHLYKTVYLVASKLGSPSSMVPPDVIAASESSAVILAAPGAGGGSQGLVVPSGCLAVVALQGLDGYKFGSANKNKFQTISLSEAEVLERGAARLMEQLHPKEGTNVEPVDFQRSLDEKVWL